MCYSFKFRHCIGFESHRFVLALFSFIVSLSLNAQETVKIQVPIKDSLSKRAIDSKYYPTFTLCDLDSTEIAMSNFAVGGTAGLQTDLAPGKYLFKVYLRKLVPLEDDMMDFIECEDYDAEWFEYDLSSIGPYYWCDKIALV